MYKIHEFRANMRKAFNDADEGHQVFIERYGQRYQLVSLVDNLDGKGSHARATPDRYEDDGRLINNSDDFGEPHVIAMPEIA